MANLNPEPHPENLRPFAPGQSGNPLGSSKRQRLTAKLHQLLDVEGVEEAFAKAGLDRGLAGEFPFWREVLARVDGLIPQAAPEEKLTLEDNRRAGQATPALRWTARMDHNHHHYHRQLDSRTRHLPGQDSWNCPPRKDGREGRRTEERIHLPTSFLLLPSFPLSPTRHPDPSPIAPM